MKTSFSILSIDEFIFKYQNIFSRFNITIFFTTFIIGFLTNLSLICKQVTNPDGVLQPAMITSLNWNIATGRSGAYIIELLRHDIVLPVFTTLVSLLVLSFCTLLLVKIYEIKSIVFGILIGMLLITFPTFSQMLTYFYMSDEFVFAMLFSILPVYVILNMKNKYIAVFISVFFLMFSMSLYQSFIGVTIVICLSRIILELLKIDNDFKTIIIKGILFLLCGLFAIFGYLISIKIVSIYSKIPLADYRGINEVQFPDFSTFLNTINEAFEAFFNFYFSNLFYNVQWWGLNIVFSILFIIIIFLIIINIIQIYTSQNINIFLAVKRIAVVLLSVILFPIFSCAIIFMTPSTSLSIFMLPQMFIPFCFIFPLIENIKWKVFNSVQWISVIIILILGFQNIMIDNTIFKVMQIKFDKTYSISARIIDRLEQTEGFSLQKPVAIIGSLDNNYSKTYIDLFTAVNKDVADWGQLWSSESNSYPLSWQNYLSRYHGFIIEPLSIEEEIRICKTDQFKNMNCFPNDGSIREIDGVLVVKLSDVTYAD